MGEVRLFPLFFSPELFAAPIEANAAAATVTVAAEVAVADGGDGCFIVSFWLANEEASRATPLCCACAAAIAAGETGFGIAAAVVGREFAAECGEEFVDGGAPVGLSPEVEVCDLVFSSKEGAGACFRCASGGAVRSGNAESGILTGLETVVVPPL